MALSDTGQRRLLRLADSASNGTMIATRVFVSLLFFMLVSQPFTAIAITPFQSDSVIARDHRWAHFVQQPGGMKANDVWSIVAMDDAIWIGSSQGVSRYNGIWTNFGDTPEGSSDTSEGDGSGDSPYGTPPLGRVRALHADANRMVVYAGDEQGSLYRWDGKVWSVMAQVGDEILSITNDGGDILVGTTSGIYVVTDGEEQLRQMLPDRRINSLDHARGLVFAGTDAGLYRLTTNEWELVPLGEVTDSGVFAVSESGQDELAIGIPDGVLILNERLEARYHLVVMDELGWPALVQALEEDAYGRLWAGTDGAGVYEIATATYRHQAHGQSNDANVTLRYVRDIAIDSDGSVWFATPSGVYRYQIGMWQLDVQGGSVNESINHVNDLLLDRDGRLWIATGGAGIRMKPRMGERERIFALGADGSPIDVLVLEEDANGSIWAGTFGGLYQFTDDEWSLPNANAQLPSSVITSLQADGQVLWIGTERGLARLELPGGTVSSVSQMDGMSIEALALDGLKRLWVGTFDDGIWMLDGAGDWKRHLADPNVDGSLPGNSVEGGGLAADWREPGHMWALLDSEGLVHWDGQRWTYESADHQLPASLSWALMSEASPGRLWIGSEHGVTQFDGLTWGSLTQDDGLRSASAFAIAAVDDGGYWFGGREGLTFYRPDATPPWVELQTLPETLTNAEDGRPTVPIGEDVSVSYTAGDLQTVRDKLLVQSRLIGPESIGEWEPQTQDSIDIDITVPGDYELQVVARDQSFNYSEVASLPVHAYVPPAVVSVPGLGEVVPPIFGALVVLGVISILGAGYIAFEILQRRRRSVDAFNRKFNPYISGEPVRSAEMFYGRRELVQRIVDTLHNNSVMIHGERRIGKTTLLYQLASLLRDVDDDAYWFVPVYVDLEGTPQQEFFHLLIEEIVLSVARLTGAAEEILPKLRDLRYRSVPGAIYDDRVFHRDLHRVIDVLDKYGERHHPGSQLRLILMLDEMDVMSRYDSIVQQQLRRIFMREFAYTVGAVVAGIRISKDWDRIESPWYNLFNEIALEPFSYEDSLALLIEPVDGYYRYTDEALDFILDQSNGRPYRLQQYGLEAVNHMLAQGRRKVNLDDALAAHKRIMTATKRESILKMNRAAPAQNASPEGAKKPV